MRQQILDVTAVVATAEDSALPTESNRNNGGLAADVALPNLEQKRKQISFKNSEIVEETRHAEDLFGPIASDENYNYGESTKVTFHTQPTFLNYQSTGSLTPVELVPNLRVTPFLENYGDEDYDNMERYVDTDNNNSYSEHYMNGPGGVTHTGMSSANMSRDRAVTQMSPYTSLQGNIGVKMRRPLIPSPQETTVTRRSAATLSPMMTSSVSDIVTSMITSTDDGSSFVSTDDNCGGFSEAAFAGGKRDSIGASVYATSSASGFSDSDCCDFTSFGDSCSKYYEPCDIRNSGYPDVVGSVPMEFSYSADYTASACFDENDVTPSVTDYDIGQENRSLSHQNVIGWKSEGKYMPAKKRSHFIDKDNNNTARRDITKHTYPDRGGYTASVENKRPMYPIQTSTSDCENMADFRLRPVRYLPHEHAKSPIRHVDRTMTTPGKESYDFKQDFKTSYVDMWRLHSATGGAAARYVPQLSNDDVISIPEKRVMSRSVPTDAGMANPDLFEVEPNAGELRSKRSIARISSGLARNVMVLREHKKLMSDVFGASLAEERVRVRELKRFQQEALEARKRILLETLEDMKCSLTGQARRLQGAYDTVLSSQCVMMKSRQTGFRRALV